MRRWLRFRESTGTRANYTLCETSTEFRQYMAESAVTLSPRGHGRGEMRLGEVLRSHNLPVSVYDDAPWVPYSELWPSFAWTATINELPELLLTLERTSEAAFQTRLATARALLPTHFTTQGALRQIGAFLVGEGDLRCQRLTACPTRVYTGSQPAPLARACAH